MEENEITLAIFIFMLGACVGSFLNVVVYRLPRDLSLVNPPSACPKCNHKLAAYDNIPIVGWLFLRGKCRYCREPISIRYPIVELITALLFLGHYFLLFHHGWGPYDVRAVTDAVGLSQFQFRTLVIDQNWPVLVLHLWLIAALLAASLIDWELFIIPLGICWWTAGVGFVIHTILIKPNQLGSLYINDTTAAATIGGGIGLLLSLLLLKTRLITRSFEEDAPLLEVESAALPEADRPDPWPPSRIRKEIAREMLFLLPPIVGALLGMMLVMKSPTIATAWNQIATEPHVNQAIASIFGALVGGAVVWFFRIGGSYGFGREAMGLGDVHLMFGVGACIGAGGATIAFFIAPAFGLLIALVVLFLKGRREIPYGPYLSLATLMVLLFVTPLQQHLAPGMAGIIDAANELFFGTGLQ